MRRKTTVLDENGDVDGNELMTLIMTETFQNHGIPKNWITKIDSKVSKALDDTFTYMLQIGMVMGRAGVMPSMMDLLAIKDKLPVVHKALNEALESLDPSAERQH